MTRHRMTRRQRTKLFEAHLGICHICKCPISHDGRWEVSHPIPLGLAGADVEANRAPAHYRCHRVRSALVDIPDIAKAKRAAKRKARSGQSPRLLRKINTPVIRSHHLRQKLADLRAKQTNRITIEQWKPVVGFEGSYEVSNLGQVRSVDRVAISRRKQGATIRRLRGRLLRPGPSRSGHLTVALRRGHSYQVHALVLTAFIGPRPKGMEGLHRDDDPVNNRLDNLRWGTRSDNLFDAIRNGKKARGQSIAHSKLTDDNVRFIKANRDSYSMSSFSRQFGVTINSIRQVLRGITWRHVQ